MSETNESAARPVHTGKTLSLKKTETSTVKQSFSHGRTKAVVVEKKRSAAPPAAVAKPAAKAAEKPVAEKAAAPVAPPAARQAGRARAWCGAAPALRRGKGAPRRRPGRC